METRETLAELDREYKPVKSSDKNETSVQKADKFNAVRTFTSKEILDLYYGK